MSKATIGYVRVMMLLCILACVAASVSGGVESAYSWKPMPGTMSASTATVNGRGVVKMPCNFAGTRIARASWDCDWKLDLTMARGVEFKFYCKDATPISHFSLYFRSGGGWYSSTFVPEVFGEWCTVRVRKDQVSIEGKPAGWAVLTACGYLHGGVAIRILSFILPA